MAVYIFFFFAIVKKFVEKKNWWSRAGGVTTPPPLDPRLQGPVMQHNPTKPTETILIVYTDRSISGYIDQRVYRFIFLFGNYGQSRLISHHLLLPKLLDLCIVPTIRTLGIGRDPVYRAPVYDCPYACVAVSSLYGIKNVWIPTIV